MTTSEWTRFGDRAAFEVGIRWVDDAEPPARRPAGYGWSMGQLDIHVAGVNVTETTLNGKRQPYMEFSRAGLAFASGAGHARLPVGYVAETIWQLLQWVVDHPPPASANCAEDMAALANAVDSLRRVDEFALATAHAPAHILQAAQAALDAMGRPDSLLHADSGNDSSVPYMAELPPAVAMFGTVSPALSTGDVEHLCGILATGHGGGDAAELAALVAKHRNEPLGVPHHDGLRLASELLEDMDLHDDGFVDVRALCKRLAIAIDEIALSTSSIRGVAVAGDGFAPQLVVNQTHYSNRDEPGQRFTIAHELCHLLFDRTRARRIAHASGPWAEPSTEQRANTFAAYLLMPRKRVFAHLQDSNLVDEAEVRRLATHLQVHESVLVAHLHNLGFIDDSTRDQLADGLRPARQRGMVAG